MSEIMAGQEAPNFRLQTDGPDPVTPTSLNGKALVLYFYPKDDTSGCTAEAIAFSQLKSQFESANAVVIGVSKDSLASHAKFAKKYDLTVSLASDPDTVVAEQFGVWVEKSMYGRKYMGMERATFLIDTQGKIAQVWRKVKVPGHAQEVLNAVQKLA